MTTSAPAAPNLSKYATNKSPTGMSIDPAANVSLVWGQHAEAIRRDLATIEPPRSSVALRYVYFDETTGEYALKDRGIVERPKTLDSSRPTKYSRQPLKGSALVDDFLAKGKSFDTAKNEILYDALLEACSTMRPPPGELRLWNDAVSLAILYRSGIDLPSRFDLPNPHPAPKEDY